jgi:hypothetical protein
MQLAEIDSFAYLCQALTHVGGPALLGLDLSTGEFVEHCQLRRDPRYKATWDMSYTNELGWLCQGIGMRSSPNTKHVVGTNTFFLINYHNILVHKWNKSATPWWFVKCIQKRMILIAPASPLAAIASASWVTSEPTPHPSNLSSCFSTACFLAKVHVSAPSTSRISTLIL